ncbi:MAG: hypothetical protein ACTS1X_12495 [Parasphingopyxis sp.]|uniref:hypothetical protein n=1 Tax=Parasphingopyxis sp. TaxID=1920299 RepID=UPI003FA11EC1
MGRLYLSNTCRLIREEGWRAVLIEGHEDRCREIRENHPDPDQVIAAHRWVGFEAGVNTIDDILRDTPIPRDFDLIRIDVDGIDWYVWESIVEYRPRMVVIEHNAMVPNNIVFVQDRDPAINEGCSLAALIELGREKGYELVAARGANAFFVVAEEFGKFHLDDNSIDAMKVDSGNYLWCCYNGKIYNTMSRMAWWGRNAKIDSESLQLLSEFRFHGTVQGRADDWLTKTATGEEDLTTADGIVREMQYLRENRAAMDPDRWAVRNRNLWVAVKAWSGRNRNWVDGSSEPEKAP